MPSGISPKAPVTRRVCNSAAARTFSVTMSSASVRTELPRVRIPLVLRATTVEASMPSIQVAGAAFIHAA